MLTQSSPLFDADANAQPAIGLILGSGMGVLVDHIQDRKTTPYHKLAGFSACSVGGHAGELHTGSIMGQPVVCLAGRPHWYEGVAAEAFHHLIKQLKTAGCDTVIILGAVGSLHKDWLPGQVVMVKDHINFQANNPLIGLTDPQALPQRGFIDMSTAYDANYRQTLHSIAQQHAIDLVEGVYVGTQGPSFETPAEIKAFKQLGADIVGMSTIPEVIVSRCYGLRVIALSAVTNLAAGLTPQALTHDVTLRGATLAVKAVSTLVLAFLEKKNNAEC